MTTRSRTAVRRLAVVLGLLAFVVLTVVLPRVYDARYNPASKALGASSAAAASAADPTWHAVPTPEQDRVYVEQTQQKAAHPNAAVEGRDGYLFLGDLYLSDFAQAMGRRYYSRAEVQQTVDVVASQKAWLKTRGVATQFVVVPASWSIYEDKMPAWSDGQIMPRIFDQLVTAAPDAFPDLRADLKAARSTGATYSRLNSHWSDYGALVAWASIARRLAVDRPELGPQSVPTVAGVRTQDSNNEFAGITGAAGPNDWTVPVLTTPLPGYTLVAADGTTSQVPGGHILDMLQMPLQTRNPAAGNTLRALVLADSATSSMSPYLAAAFGSTMMVRHHADDPVNAPNLPALVEAYHPDVVITLLTERNLDIITPDSQTWLAAVAYDAAPSSRTTGWAPDGSVTGVAVSSPDLGAPVTVVPKAPAAGGPIAPSVLRLEVTSAGPATLTLSGSASAGPFSTPLRVAAGSNVVFARVPGGLSDAGLRLERTAGQGAASITRLSVRALP